MTSLDVYKRQRKYYRLDDFGVLSPATVLTQERQTLVNIPLTQITNLLVSANLESVKWDEVKNYSKEFFKDFSQKEYEEYQKILFNNNKEAVDVYKRQSWGITFKDLKT